MGLSDQLDDTVKKLGFESGAEFCRLVASVDMSAPEKLQAFRRWQVTDGTKEGLLKLPVKQPDEVINPPEPAVKPTPKRKKVTK